MRASMLQVGHSRNPANHSSAIGIILLPGNPNPNGVLFNGHVIPGQGECLAGTANAKEAYGS
jgi:hypothetical protein